MFSNVATKTKQVLSSLEFWAFLGSLYLLWVRFNIFDMWPYFYFGISLATILTIVSIWGFGWLVVVEVKRKRAKEKPRLFQILKLEILGVVAFFALSYPLIFVTSLGEDYPPVKVASLDTNGQKYILLYKLGCFIDCVEEYRLFRCDQQGEACQVKDKYLPLQRVQANVSLESAYSMQFDKTNNWLNIFDRNNKLVYTFKSP